MRWLAALALACCGFAASNAAAVAHPDATNPALEDIIDLIGVEVTIGGGSLTVDFVMRDIPATVPTNTLRFPPGNSAFNLNLTERTWQVMFDVDGNGGNSAGDLVITAFTASMASQPQGTAPLANIIAASRRIFTATGMTTLGAVQSSIVGNRVRVVQPLTAAFAAVSESTPFRITTFKNLYDVPTDAMTAVRDLLPKTGGYFTPTGQTTGAFIYRMFNTGLDHYFITADRNEVEAILAGAAGPGWTQLTQMAVAGGTTAVCRFYGVQANGGPNGHFYTADDAECAAVKLDPGWHFESLDFRTTPAAASACPAGLTPILRAYNNRFAFQDSNHFFTTSLFEYNQKIAQGFSGEGAVFCSTMLFGPVD